MESLLTGRGRGRVGSGGSGRGSGGTGAGGGGSGTSPSTVALDQNLDRPEHMVGSVPRRLAVGVLGARLSGCGMIMDVRSLVVVLLFVLLAVVVAMRQRVVVVFMRVPEAAVFPLAQRQVPTVMVRDVVVIVAVG